MRRTGLHSLAVEAGIIWTQRKTFARSTISRGSFGRACESPKPLQKPWRRRDDRRRHKSDRAGPVFYSGVKNPRCRNSSSTVGMRPRKAV